MNADPAADVAVADVARIKVKINVEEAIDVDNANLTIY
jgi:hypothetical protein